jgi:thiol-disulfide isomerase/thioredoxin
MNYYVRGTSLALLFLNIVLSPPALAADAGIHLLYFFSATCPHCKQTTPIVSELSNEMPVEGIFAGSEDPGPLPFPIKKGTKADKERYNIQGVPALVVLQNGKTRQVISGEGGIKTCRTLIKGIARGALTVSEAIEKESLKTYKITGWVVSRGNYFKGAKFFLTDQQQTIAIKPWLPL